MVVTPNNVEMLDESDERVLACEELIDAQLASYPENGPRLVELNWSTPRSVVNTLLQKYKKEGWYVEDSYKYNGEYHRKRTFLLLMFIPLAKHEENEKRNEENEKRNASALKAEQTSGRPVEIGCLIVLVVMLICIVSVASKLANFIESLFK